MSSVINKKRTRGNALMVIAYIGAVLGCAVGVYFYSSSHNLAKETETHENTSKAQEAARFGVEQVVANLSRMKLVEITDGKWSVEKDWVGLEPFGNDPARETERRILGQFADYEFVAQARAVREAKENDVMPDNWLAGVDPKPYNYGVDELRKFTGTYEITASARSRHRTDEGSTTGVKAPEATVRTLISIDYNSLMNKLEDMAILHPDRPELFGPDPSVGGPGLTTVAVLSGSGGGEGGGGEGGGGGGQGSESTARDSTLFSWGEDHYAVRAVAKETLEEQIIEDFISIPRDSQLFSVNNGYYSAAAQTMQYRTSDDPEVRNPNIPRWPRFGNQPHMYQMISLRDDIPIDQYIFGGKQQTNNWERLQENGAYLKYYYGRSVHLLENGEIQERSESDGNPDGHAQTALAVGRIENFLKLYLNYATNRTYGSAPSSMPSAPHPPATAAATAVQNWKNTWHQVPLGYHSKATSYSRNMPPQNRPLDNQLTRGAGGQGVRRWNVLIWIKNSEGRFLAREYTDPKYINQSTYSRTGYPPANNTWNGRYRWYYYKGYQDSDSTRWHMGTPTHATRNRNSLAIHTRFLTMEELLGFKLIKDNRDNVPARWANKPTGATDTPEFINPSEVAGGVPDYYLVGGEKQPFLVNGSQFDEVRQRDVSRGDNWGLTAAMDRNYQIPGPGVPMNVFPPPDGIYVNDDNGNYKKHTTLRDFAYEVDIGTPGNPDIREMVDLHMVIEDSLEQSGGVGNQYFDMGNTVTLVFPKGTTSIVDDEDFLADSLKQWWEGEREESLTGNPADWALSSRPDRDLALAYEGDDLLKEYFRKFGIAYIDVPVSTISTSTDDTGALSGFQRAVFTSADPAKLDEDIVGASPTGNFYYGLNDLYAIYAKYPGDFKMSALFSATEVEQWKDDPDMMADLLEQRRRTLAVQLMTSRNSGVTFLPLDERFDVATLNDDHLAEEKVTPLHMPGEEINSRYIASLAFGVANNRGPSVYVKVNRDGTYDPLLQTDLRASAPAGELVESTYKLTNFLPGELSLWPGATTLDVPSPEPENYQTHVPMMAKDAGKTQPDGTLLKPKFIWESGTAIEDPEKEETMDTLYNAPDWFATTFAAIRSDNPMEHRGALGWHRAGPHPDVSDVEDPDEVLKKHRDHYEYVIMGRKGFNPYRTVRARYPADITTGTYLAAFRPKDTALDDLSNYKHMLVPTDEMPTFVFENELDGAGILVVNGNLTVRGTFAYHGLLIVTGDLRVEAVSGFRTNSNGDYVNEKGDVLTRDPATNRWYYIDAEGNMQYSERVTVWKGEVIVQGKLMVGNRIITDTGDENSTPVTPPGRVEVRGSRQAIKDTVDLWTEVAPYERFETERYGWSTDASSTTTSYNLWGD